MPAGILKLIAFIICMALCALVFAAIANAQDPQHTYAELRDLIGEQTIALNSLSIENGKLRQENAVLKAEIKGLKEK